MIKAPLSYQASYFADLGKIVPSADVIPPLLEAFRDVSFISTTFVQFIGGTPHTRLRLAPVNQEWFVDLELQRINVMKNPILAWGDNLGSVEDFISDATDFIKRVLACHPIQGNRLALVTRHLLNVPDTNGLSTAYERVVNPLDFYTDSAPHEWQTRASARIEAQLEGRQEILNVLSTVARVQGRFTTPDAVTEFDGVSADIDVNTYQGNTEPRFDADSLESFFAKGQEIRLEVLKQIGERLELN